MRSLVIVLLVALGCLALAEGQCPRTCPNINRPVCASWTRRGIIDICTFRNDCTLQNQICQRNQNWIKRLPEEACLAQTSNCRSLLQ